MKEFIEYLIKHLVDKPEEVQINEIAGERAVVFELRVGDGDMGKVIGRGGQTARSLRILLTAAAAKQGKRVVLEILEDETEKAIGSEWKTTYYKLDCIMHNDIHIEKSSISRVSQVDFDNIPFGRIFSDHMFEAEYRDGDWCS